MIGRIWHGWAAREDADAYQAMLNSDVLPGIHRIKGYRGAYVMRRDVGDEVEFMTMTLRSEEHTSELQSQSNLVCRLLLEKKKKITNIHSHRHNTVQYTEHT